MAWTDPPAWAAGAILTAAQMNTNVRDNLKAIGDPWTAYTPTWTAATTNPALGNGSLTGARLIAGKDVRFRVNLLAGSTTTFGSGQYSISLPTAAAAGSGFQPVHAEALIGGALYRLMGRIAAGGSTVLLYCDPTTAGAAMRTVTNTVPATFANASQINIIGSYEAA